MSGGQVQPPHSGVASTEVSIRELVRRVVANTAPDELSLLDALSDVDDATIVRRFRSRGRKRDPLAFGPADLVPLVTPVVWLAVEQAAQRFGENAADSASARLKSMLRRLFRRPPRPTMVPLFDNAQLVEVEAEVTRLSAEYELDPERAARIAARLVDELKRRTTPEFPDQRSR